MSVHYALIMNSLQKLGRHADMATRADEAAAVAPGRPDEPRFAAIWLARCAALALADKTLEPRRRQELADQYLDRSVALLRRAVANGFRGFDGIRQKDLELLGARADFRQLRAEVEASPPPVDAGRR
jgi:hypothetical protein